MDGEKAGGVLFMKGIAEFFRAFSLVRNWRAIRTRWDFQRRYLCFMASMPHGKASSRMQTTRVFFKRGTFWRYFIFMG